jgi:hypothetical protein
VSRFRAIVQIDLEARDIDAVDDLVHAIWSDGDPGDATNATLWTTDVTELPEEEL